MTPGERRNLRNGLLFIAPWAVGFLLFNLYPLLMSVYYSFCDYSVLNPPVWLGLDNYFTLVQDEIFWKSIWNTLYFAGVSIPAGAIVSILVAMLLNTKVKFMETFRTCYFIPSLVPMVAMAMLWMWIFNPQYGILNLALGALGIEGPNWLGDARTAMPSLILTTFWGVGQGIVIYLAGLQDVPKSLLEAAEIDGAGWWHKTVNVTLPMISPVIFFNVIMGIIGALQAFVQPYIMTAGGPARATLFYNLYLYQKAFEDYEMGYASAMAWILFLLIVFLSLGANKLSKRFVYYRSERPAAGAK